MPRLRRWGQVSRGKFLAPIGASLLRVSEPSDRLFEDIGGSRLAPLRWRPRTFAP
jgi:hypothetical protein